MAEVSLTFDILVNRTVEKTGTSTVSIRTTGNEKSSFTVVLGCQANGQKLPPMVIFKRKPLPKEKFPASVIIKANTKGWMDKKMSERSLRQETGWLFPQMTVPIDLRRQVCPSH